MFDYDKWQEIFGTIKKHKTRTLLTALGVFWGIFMLVFLMGSGKGLENGVMTNFGDRAANALYVWTQNTTMPYAGLQPGRRVRLTEDDITAIRTNFKDQLQYIAPRIYVSTGEIARNNKSGSFTVRGEAPDLLHIEAIKIKEGRFINPLDMEERRKVIVIGGYVRDLLFQEEEEVIGQYLTISGIDYKIVGIFKSSRGGGDGSDDEQTIFMPMRTAQQVTNMIGRIGWFVCTMQPHVRVSSVEDDLKGLLRARHKIHPDDDQGIRAFNLEEEFGEVQGLFFGIRFIVWIVGIGSLLAGIIGVGNIMLIIVKERTKEIGIRKSMGATPRSIVSMILLESVFITTVAGYLGLLSSTGIIWALNEAVGEGSEYFANPQIDPLVGVAAVVILIGAGALTGLLPALQAARVNPVVALKDE